MSKNDISSPTWCNVAELSAGCAFLGGVLAFLVTNWYNYHYTYAECHTDNSLLTGDMLNVVNETLG